MIFVENLLKELKKNKIDYFSGVPDSVLKNFTNHLEKNKKFKNLTLTNEGSAVAAGIGYYLATQKVPGVYMQNSGLGNSINPLISIAHNKVYSIPLILIIGWRGSPRVKDEPQHNVKGKVTQELLKLLNIKYTILRTKKDLIKFDKQIKFSKKNNSIIACLIEQGTFETNEFRRFSESDLKDSLDNENDIMKNKDEVAVKEPRRLDIDYQLNRAVDLIKGINIYQETLSE